jgi:hypothetical protein
LGGSDHRGCGLIGLLATSYLGAFLNPIKNLHHFPIAIVNENGGGEVPSGQAPGIDQSTRPDARRVDRVQLRKQVTRPPGATLMFAWNGLVASCAPDDPAVRRAGQALQREAGRLGSLGDGLPASTFLQSSVLTEPPVGGTTPAASFNVKADGTCRFGRTARRSG